MTFKILYNKGSINSYSMVTFFAYALSKALQTP